MRSGKVGDVRDIERTWITVEVWVREGREGTVRKCERETEREKV